MNISSNIFYLEKGLYAFKETHSLKNKISHFYDYFQVKKFNVKWREEQFNQQI